MITINVFDIIGKNALTASHGKDINSKIIEAFHDKKKVTLNFKKVSIVAGPFLNNSIGVLYRDFSSEFISENLDYTDFPVGFLDTVNMVKNNAIKFYGATNENR